MMDPQRVREERAVAVRMSSRRPARTPRHDRPTEETGRTLEGFEHRSSELAKLDALEELLWDALDRPRVRVDRGSVVLDPLTGEPVLESGPDLRVVDRLLRLALRRAEVQGSDAPRRREVAVVTEEMLLDLIEKMETDTARLKETRPG